MKEKNTFSKIKKTIIAGAVTTMLAGNAAGMEFRVNTAPNSEPVRVEQTLPKSVQDFQGEYDATDALKLYEDMGKGSALRKLDSINKDDIETLLAAMPECETEIVDYLRRSKINNHKLKAAYEKFYEGKQIPSVINRILNAEMAFEIRKNNNGNFYLGDPVSSFDDICDEITTPMVNLNLEDKPENYHLLVDTSELDGNRKTQAYSLRTKIHEIIIRNVKHARDGKEYENLKQEIITYAKALSPKIYGDYNMRMGLLAELANDYYIKELAWCCRCQNIDFRQFILEAAKTNEQTQETSVNGSEMEM